ncbi:efflux RND transporter periplasmic adaptor subunit [Gloeobacter morelensis]|uniref:Efflux RND transporter periplasmic adaptor subunit n=1 Tax=Gloeobacter morelensis MG652769 TaxID=2781736 RepID=A0ABY3PHC2_9CYAN|nr:efflux RND transporter periplasmic adaptor subunit [Gloeobacter morelensis]UFP93055.1 efflux RND transporter periplasmic adaptor subunit [Gloeobacter morelensis MG652769]
MNQNRSYALLRSSLLLAALWLVGCAGKETSKAGEKAAAAPPPTVVATEVLQKSVPIYGEYVARTAASQTVDLRARVEGFLERAFFKEGSFVEKGTLLFTIDKRSYEAELQAARAQLSRAQADLIQAQQQVRSLKAQAELASADAQRTRTLRDLTRAQALEQEGALSERDLDVAVANERAAAAEVEARQATLRDTALNQRVAIDQAKAAVEAAKSAVRQAELKVSYTEIRAPISGIIGRIQSYPGNLVGKGESTLLATISAVDPLKVDFSISEADYLRFARRNRPNTPATPQFELLLADGSSYSYKGRFNSVDRAVNLQTGTLQLQALFPNPERLLRDGQFGRVRVPIENRPNAVLVPQRSVQEVQGNKTVLVVGTQNKVALRSVTLGPSYQSFYVVEAGIQPGERVIVEGLQKARPGLPVTLAANPVATGGQR